MAKKNQVALDILQRLEIELQDIRTDFELDAEGDPRLSEATTAALVDALTSRVSNDYE